MIRQGDMSGSESTWATMKVWDESLFCYVEVLEHVRGQDAREAYAALHKPPMLIVRSIRYGSNQPIFPCR